MPVVFQSGTFQCGKSVLDHQDSKMPAAFQTSSISDLCDKNCVLYDEKLCDLFEYDLFGPYEDQIFGSSSVIFPGEDIWNKFDFSSSFDDKSFLSNSSEHDQFEQLKDPCMNSPVFSFEHLTGNTREIRQHDCMWAGHCVSKDHNRTFRSVQTPITPVKTAVQNTIGNKPESGNVKTMNSACKNERTKVINSVNISQPTKTVNGISLVKTSGRSLLLNSRSVPKIAVPEEKSKIASPGISVSPVMQRICSPINLDSEGDCGRPETPPSLSESEEEFENSPQFKHNFEIFSNALRTSNSDDYSVCDFKDLFVEEESDVSSLAESSENGQVQRTPDAKNADNQTNTATKILSYYSDHSYFQHHNKALTDSLGVQTPSDSEEEEEIDVVTCEKLPSSRSSSATGHVVSLPTNPSFWDRQELQRTMASAINAHSRNNNSQGRGRSQNYKKRAKCSSSDEEVQTSRGSNKGVKRARYHRMNKTGRKGRRGGSRSGSSDSETDFCEKRSLHNNMERQRRIDLRNLFEYLRLLVPEVQDKQRAAKVVILREASSFCQKLTQENIINISTIAMEKSKQEKLRARVSLLRRSLAAQR